MSASPAPTPDELVRGTGHALLAFNVVVTGAMLTIGVQGAIASAMAGFSGAVWSGLLIACYAAGIALIVGSLVSTIGAAIFGAPLAWIVSRWLAREPRRWVHALAYGATGLVVGAIVALLVLVLLPPRAPHLDARGVLIGSTPQLVANPGLVWAALALAAVAAGSSVWGWWLATRRTRRPSRRTPKR